MWGCAREREREHTQREQSTERKKDQRVSSVRGMRCRWPAPSITFAMQGRPLDFASPAGVASLMELCVWLQEPSPPLAQPLESARQSAQAEISTPPPARRRSWHVEPKQPTENMLRQSPSSWAEEMSRLRQRLKLFQEADSPSYEQAVQSRHTVPESFLRWKVTAHARPHTEELRRRWLSARHRAQTERRLCGRALAMWLHWRSVKSIDDATIADAANVRRVFDGWGQPHAASLRARGRRRQGIRSVAMQPTATCGSPSSPCLGHCATPDTAPTERRTAPVHRLAPSPAMRTMQRARRMGRPTAAAQPRSPRQGARRAHLVASYRDGVARRKARA